MKSRRRVNSDVMQTKNTHSSKESMDSELRAGDGSVQHFLPIAGVALAGIIQVSSQSGPFNLWNVMIGAPLILLLAAYEPRVPMKRTERWAWSVTWGLTATSTFGILFQAVYRFCKNLPGLWPPFFDAKGNELTRWEAPYQYYFLVWLLLSGVAFLYFRRHRLPKPVTKVAPDESA